VYGIKMDICIGGIFDGQKIENNNDFFKVEEHYSDHSLNILNSTSTCLDKFLLSGFVKMLI